MVAICDIAIINILIGFSTPQTVELGKLLVLGGDQYGIRRRCHNKQFINKNFLKEIVSSSRLSRRSSLIVLKRPDIKGCTVFRKNTRRNET